MNPSRFLYGGTHLGEADIMAKRGLNGAGVLSKAASQLNASGSAHGKAAASKAQQIGGDFQRLGGQIGQALALAQKEAGACYQAVSCGWWLGTVYGCCQHGVQDVPSSELMGNVLRAAEHATALSGAGSSSWNSGKIDHEFGTVAESVGGLVGVDALKKYAPKLNTLVSQFAASLR